MICVCNRKMPFDLNFKVIFFTEEMGVGMTICEDFFVPLLSKSNYKRQSLLKQGQY